MNIGEKNKPINSHFSLAYRVAVLIYMKKINAEKSHHQHQESGEGCNQINEKENKAIWEWLKSKFAKDGPRENIKWNKNGQT